MKRLAWIATVLMLAGAAHAQTKSVRMIISFPPGGVTDAVARILAQKMAENMGQPVTVENRAGGNYVIAAEAAAAAPPDGHTLFMAVDSTFTLNPLQYAKLSYDVDRDFAPVSLVGVQALFIVGSGKAPFKNFPELLAYAKGNPGKATFGTSSLTTQLIGEQIKARAGVDILHVAFKGSPPMLQALLAGDIDFSVTTFTPYASYVKDGRLRGLAVTGTGREPPSPDTPTLAELGYGEFTHQLWFGLFVPAATPKPILDRLHAETVKALADPETRQRFAAAGAEARSSTPAELRARLQTDLDKWTKVIKAAGIKLTN